MVNRHSNIRLAGRLGFEVDGQVAVHHGRMTCDVFDIAAGHGRYILEALAGLRDSVESIRLRDLSDINVAAGRKLIEQEGWSASARFEQGDAFDGHGLSTLVPKPTLAVVSGLYELFPQNAPVRTSLGGLAQAVEPGGYLVYTSTCAVQLFNGRYVVARTPRQQLRHAAHRAGTVCPSHHRMEHACTGAAAAATPARRACCPPPRVTAVQRNISYYDYCCQ